MKGETVEDQILWVLTCINRGVIDSQKEIIENNLKESLREYVTLKKFFGEIRKEFGKKEKVKGKKVEDKIQKEIESLGKKKPKVETMTPRILAVERDNGF